jgi:SAM-dependent methyltransferase
MFGPTLDHLLLKPFCHARNRRTEQELEVDFRTYALDFSAAEEKVRKFERRFGGHFIIDPNASYLDVGCGRGELACALALLGAGEVAGLDITPRSINASRESWNLTRQALARSGKQAGHDASFFVGDAATWLPPKRYDYVISNEALEHINDPGGFLVNLKRLAKPHGKICIGFGPLFYSMYGDHLDEFFRVQIPWRGALFSEQALLRLREEFFRPGDSVERFEDVVGGLNKMRYRDFLNDVKNAGLQIRFLSHNPQFSERSYLRPIAPANRLLCSLPLIRNYWIMSVYAVLSGEAAAFE